jgi:hypothetical protein
MVIADQTILQQTTEGEKKLTSKTNSALQTTGLAMCTGEDGTESSKCFSSKTGELDVATAPTSGLMNIFSA